MALSEANIGQPGHNLKTLSNALLRNPYFAHMTCDDMISYCHSAGELVDELPNQDDESLKLNALRLLELDLWDPSATFNDWGNAAKKVFELFHQPTPNKEQLIEKFFPEGIRSSWAISVVENPEHPRKQYPPYPNASRLINGYFDYSRP